jgi:homoserine kinase
MDNELKIFAPATIANVSCGFDVLGLALDTVGDEMIVRKVPEKGVRITKIVGQNLPLETENNVAGVAALALLKQIVALRLKSTSVSNLEVELEVVRQVQPVRYGLSMNCWEGLLNWWI